MRTFSASTIPSVTSDVPTDQLRPVLGGGRQLGHQHIELALEMGQEGVELATGLDLGPGQPIAAWASSTVPFISIGGRVLGHPPPIEKAGGAVVPGPRVDPHRLRTLAQHRLDAKRPADDDPRLTERPDRGSTGP